MSVLSEHWWAFQTTRFANQWIRPYSLMCIVNLKLLENTADPENDAFPSNRSSPTLHRGGFRLRPRQWRGTEGWHRQALTVSQIRYFKEKHTLLLIINYPKEIQNWLNILRICICGSWRCSSCHRHGDSQGKEDIFHHFGSSNSTSRCIKPTFKTLLNAGWTRRVGHIHPPTSTLDLLVEIQEKIEL